MLPDLTNRLSRLRNGFIILLLLSMAIFVSLPVHAHSMSRKLQRALYNAQQAHDKGETKKAIQFLTIYLEQNPGKAPAVLFSFLGSLYFQDEHAELAYEAFKQGFRLDPTSGPICRNLAVAAYQTGKLKMAATYFEKAYDLFPEKETDLLYQAATIHFSESRYDNTIRIVERHRRIVREAAPRWLKLLIYCYLEKKENRKAITEIRAYLERYPHDAEYWEMLAKIYLDAGDYRKGAANLEVFYSLSPPDDMGWLELADLYLYLNAPLKAIACFEQVKERFAEKTLEKMVAAYRNTCQLKKAAILLTEALAEQETAERFKTRGMIYYDDGAYRKSMASLSKSLELDPDQNETHLLLGYAALELEELETARKAFSNMISDPYWKSQADAGLRIVNTLTAARQEAESSAMDM